MRRELHFIFYVLSIDMLTSQALTYTNMKYQLGSENSNVNGQSTFVRHRVSIGTSFQMTVGRCWLVGQLVDGRNVIICGVAPLGIEATVNFAVVLPSSRILLALSTLPSSSQASALVICTYHLWSYSEGIVLPATDTIRYYSIPLIYGIR